MLNIIDLKYQYGDGTKALNGIDIKIEKGEKAAVLGSNGSGKSTLFLCLNGVLQPSSGKIEISGEPIRYDKKGLIDVRRQVGIVFQDPEIQLFCLNVYQEVAFGPSNIGYDKEEIKKRTEESMKKVDVDVFRDKPPHFLSYGQKKRVSIASVLSMDPQLVIFDEPTSALDPIHSRQTMKIMDELNRQGITVIMSTHDMDLAFSWADRVIVLKDGQVFRQGSPEEVFSDDEAIREANLYQPAVFRLYNKLREKGMFPGRGPVPRSVEELEEKLMECE